MSRNDVAVNLVRDDHICILSGEVFNWLLS